MSGMQAITAAFYNAITSNPGIGLILVDRYRDRPPVHVRRPIPSDTPYPCIVTAGNVADIDEDTKTGEIRTILRDVYIYDRAANGVNTVEQLAELVRSTFHNQAFTVEGWQVILSRCTGPSVAPTDETLEGRLVQVSFTITKG